uniref:Uncharacterized protein LOC110220127 n=1 Tax=Phascolarctos cinereus TaxID=38626 RepID=A0A6P5LMV3_PHACI|nr:uncharacterized protein LOC110220127 [Phascolarctos cinereus]
MKQTEVGGGRVGGILLQGPGTHSSLPASPGNFSSRTLVPAKIWRQACAALQSCPEDSPFIPSPQRTHCYRGALKLMSGNLSLPLAVWGCASWASCSLLGGLWTPGPIALRETCEDEGEMRDVWDRWTGRDGAVFARPRTGLEGTRCLCLLASPVAILAAISTSKPSFQDKPFPVPHNAGASPLGLSASLITVVTNHSLLWPTWAKTFSKPR